jgi:hypothetical protein
MQTTNAKGNASRAIAPAWADPDLLASDDPLNFARAWPDGSTNDTQYATANQWPTGQ